jgi:hypothetical protein
MEAPAMRQSERPVWFVGDLDDPWVAEIAGATPCVVARVDATGDWLAALPEDLRSPATLVLHRTILNADDVARLARLRADREPAPRVVLCVGPHARHADLERCAALADAIIPEATARDTIARHVAAIAPTRGPGPRPRVAVVAADFALRQAMADACEAIGFPVATAAGWSDAPPSGPAVWDVPVLEPDWLRALARRSRTGPVVALLGFADRASVAEARAHGASACLESPCDLADLAVVLDRLAVATVRAEAAHDVPPGPRGAPSRPSRVEAAG